MNRSNFDAHRHLNKHIGFMSDRSNWQGDDSFTVDGSEAGFDHVSSTKPGPEPDDDQVIGDRAAPRSVTPWIHGAHPVLVGMSRHPETFSPICR